MRSEPGYHAGIVCRVLQAEMLHLGLADPIRLPTRMCPRSSTRMRNRGPRTGRSSDRGRASIQVHWCGENCGASRRPMIRDS